jgi:hypothetical protein
MMRSFTGTLAAVLLLSGALFSRSAALGFVVYGDTQSAALIHQQVIDAYADIDPDLVLNVGDLWLGYEDSSAEFRDIVGSHENIADLLDDNRFLVALGNHDFEEQVLAFSPPIVRDNSIRYSFTQDNSFFVCMGLDPSENLDWCERRLASDESRSARWRFVYCHYPVYSSSNNFYPDHLTRTSDLLGKPEFEALCDRYRVTMVFGGHAHNYERTFPIYGAHRAGSDQTTYADSGTVYVVTGGGGGELRPSASGIAFEPGENWWTAVFEAEHHYCHVTTTNDRVTLVARTPEGALLDSVVIVRAPGKAAVTNRVGAGNRSTGPSGVHTNGQFLLDGRQSASRQKVSGILVGTGQATVHPRAK